MRICGIWGNFVKIWYFVNTCLIEVRILKLFCTCVTHIIVIIYSTANFVNLIDFQLNTDFPSQFSFFTVKSPSVTQRSVSQENAFKTSKNPSLFCFCFLFCFVCLFCFVLFSFLFFLFLFVCLFCRPIGSNNSFTLIENNFWFLR